MILVLRSSEKLPTYKVNGILAREKTHNTIEILQNNYTGLTGVFFKHQFWEIAGSAFESKNAVRDSNRTTEKGTTDA